MWNSIIHEFHTQKFFSPKSFFMIRFLSFFIFTCDLFMIYKFWLTSFCFDIFASVFLFKPFFSVLEWKFDESIIFSRHAGAALFCRRWFWFVVSNFNFSAAFWFSPVICSNEHWMTKQSFLFLIFKLESF